MYQQPKENLETLSGRQAILEMLDRATRDNAFLAQLAENPYRVLGEYNLTLTERAALAKGDIARVESWVGQLDERLRTWFKVRLTRERW